MALTAKMVTQKEFDDFKKGIKSDNAKAARKKGKTTNYASVYNAGPPKIAQAAGVPLEEGKALHTAYWKLNWSVKAIAEEQVVIEDSRGDKWLVNPINGFCYSLRKDSDRFSTLAQGTGSYFFDMWVDNILEGMQERWGKKTLTGSFHDEKILTVKDNPKVIEAVTEIVETSIDKVNKEFKLRRLLGCESQVGKRYSEIH
jgi:DNA polymerase I-like protein with 3'-5' exonuclease and polymerase domains